MSIPIPFVGPAYTLDSLPIAAQRCLNWFPEVGEGKNNIVLRPTPGMKHFTTPNGTGGIRGMYTSSNNRFFVVRGTKVSEILSSGQVVERGTLISSAGIVRMTDNGTQLIVADGVSGYILTLATNVFAAIADTDYPKGSFVCYIDGYFIVNKNHTEEFYWSALKDGTSWDALDVKSSEGNPDQINAMITLGRELWVFGKRSYEVFYNSGDANIPFQRIEGAFNDVGCVAPDSVARLNTNVFWVGSNNLGHGTIFMSNGYSPQSISTVPIEEAIESYSDLSNATGFCYSQNGHDFYCVSFPNGKATWCFDLQSGMWHERNYTNSNNESKIHRAVLQEFFNGKNYVGDYLTGKIHEFDTDTFDDDGEEIHRVRSSPHIWNNLDRVFYSSFQLDIETGVGLTSGQGEDPQVMLDWSNDGGRTWSKENWRSMGKLGEYRTRVKWNRLGAARDRIFRVKITDPVKCNILGAVIT